MKKTLALLLALLLTLSLASVSLAEAAAATVKNPSVAVVVAGALGDRSFFDSANGGLEKLKAEGIEGVVIECKEDASLYEQSLISAAEQYDIVFAVGWQFWECLEVVAAEMPDAKFVFIDNQLTGVPNIFSVTYAENEGSFLVGYIAATLSKTGIIGAIGGEDNITINDFIVGYKQGAALVNPNIKVEVSYTADYEDPAKGKEHALAMYGRGVDIIFQVAGKTGEGVFEAAAETGNFAIGVDSDQKFINPDVIICSMMKQVGLSIYSTVKEYMETGEFRGGTAWEANMDGGYIGVGYGDDTMTQQVTPELKAQVESLQGMIVSGAIEVATTR